MPRRRGSGRSAARGRAPTATADNGKKSRNFQENTSSRSRSSSSSASSRPTSTKPTPAPPPPAPPPVEPVEQRWEEEAGMYKHKKFKKMASSVVVTSVTTPVPQATPIHTVAPPLLQATPTLSFQPLKHSALSLISAAEEPSPIENSRKNVCPYCNISCAKPSVLDKHIRTHTNERPYPCTPCQIAFKTQSNLYKHCRSRTHALKVDKGIDSSSVEMVAELGESFKEELEQRLPMLDAVQKLQKSSNAAVLIREEPRDLSSANKIPSFLQRPMTFLPQQPQQQQQQPQRRLPNGISLTNSVELTQPRPANDYVQQRIDKVISQNQAIVETLDPLWPRRYMRQNSKDQPGLEPAVSMVTVEKTRNKISSGQVTMSLVQSQPKVQQHNPSLVVVRQPQDQPQNHEADILNAKSVKELWIRMSNDQQDKVQQSEGAMIKELLLKRRGATTLEPASMASIPNERRDSNSSSSSNSSNQIHAVLQVTKSSFDPQQVKLALPNVSLIRTSPQVVTSMMSKARFLPSGLISTPSAQVQAPPEFLKCNLCQKTFSGIDLELHQREYCPAVPRKHGLIMEPSDHHSPLKKPRLTILSQNQQNQQVKSILNNSAGGIVTVSKAPLQQTNMNSGGLLQIAKPIVSSTQVNKIEAKNIISSTSIAGIPVPNLAGVLTGIKPASTQTLFSLPGKISQPLQIPGIPGPSKEAASTIQPALEIKPEIKIEISKSASEADSGKFLRPNSLPLTPGSFKTKKHVMLSGGDTLVSPETPRPRKSYMLQYQNGTAYTTLGFKSSTKVYYTTIFHQQPMYVANKPRISMYSNWRVVTKDSHPSGLSPGQSLNAYNSNSSGLDQNGLFASAGVGRQSNVSDNMIVSHSSKWKAVKEAAKVEKAEKAEKAQKPTTSTSTSATPSGVARTVEGGYKSLDDDYTYVRGRGRGRYVCNACGIRCKKPSMLKKHIRTHTNFRPYTCKHCNFAFKTKGNLTKHMKSKTHHKKCVELGISPIPTTVPDDYTGSMDQGPGPSDLNNANKPVAGDSDTEDEDMEEEEEEDEDQFEDAESDVEIIGEDNGMVSKGLLPYRPKLGLTYPYNMKRSEAETVSTAASVTSGDNLVVSAAAAVACSSSTSLQPISSQAPVLGEKYYFSKSPISNDVAKAAAETVMAIASSALNASASPVASLTAKSETKPVTVLSFINDNKTESGLQAYLQAKAIKASSQTLAPIPEEQATPQRIGSLTIERASSISNDHSQGPRNVTMNVMDMPASARLPTPKATVHLPQDIQLISVSQKQQPPQPQTVASVKSTHESMMTSPPNKTLAEAIKAEANNEEVKQSTSSNGGKFVCNVCKKDFPTNALLNIHTKIHYFERPYRCDACAVSFRTHGHLQKHKRSSGHFNKVNINETFGAPSTSNPRPFYCGDCKIGFRIHGHLAKHLRSKSHIMKLENSGKLPIGMFAEMERLGTNLNEIDTSDCDTSLASLKQMAARLCKNKEITVDASNTNGLLSPQPPKEAIEPLAEIKEEPMESYRKSPEYVIRPHPPPLQAPQAPPTNGIALNLSLPTSSDKPQDRRASFSSSGQDEPSTDSEAETGLVNKLQAERYQCNQCPQVLKDLKSLQIHQFVDHHHDANAGNSPRLIAPPPAPVQAPPPVQHYRQHVPVQPQPTRSFPPPNPPHFTNGLIGSREGSISSDSGEGGPVSPVLRCELCGLSNFSSTKALQQHIFSHAQARPHVCPRCDAGFATLHQLDAHMKLH